jgi:hypothetical protein
MNEFPDIINSQIISSKWDIFWTMGDENINSLSPRPVLVVTAPFTTGSAEETQLKKMLQACELQEDDYHIIQAQPGTGLAWHWLRDHLQIKSLILLGIEPQQLGVSAQLMPHQLSRFNDTNWIVTGSLEQLIQYPDIKGHLWKYGLKPAFVDKVYG